MKFNHIEHRGVGVNYRSEIGKDILENIAEIDFLEVYTEKFFIKNEDPIVEAIIAKIPLVLHGLDLSIGSNKPLDMKYYEKLSSSFKEINFEWFSDHISLTEEEVEVGHLMPVQFSEVVLNNITTKVKMMKQLTSKPFLLENITYYYPIPGSEYSEDEFITRILEQSDCGMLLDLNNLYINAKNLSYDPYEFLHKIPLERVVEIHLAGGSFKEGMLVDTHANPIRDEVWKLLDYTCKVAPFKGVIIERDANLKDFNDLIDEVKIAKNILAKNGKK
jgi:uncharacterized protein (UPF0276 family)